LDGHCTFAAGLCCHAQAPLGAHIPPFVPHEVEGGAQRTKWFFINVVGFAVAEQVPPEGAGTTSTEPAWLVIDMHVGLGGKLAPLFTQPTV
jgi:hypothetical protein